MKTKIIIIFLLLSGIISAQTKLELPYDSVKHIRSGKYWKAYFNSGDALFNTNQGNFQFNKSVIIPSGKLFKIGTDTLPIWPDVRTYVSTHGGVTSIDTTKTPVPGHYGTQYDLSLKLNSADSIIKYVTPTQLQNRASASSYIANVYLSSDDHAQSGYKYLDYEPDVATSTTGITANNNTVQGLKYLYSQNVGSTFIPGGQWGFEFYGNVSNNSLTSTASVRVFKKNVTETTLFTSTSEDINNTSDARIVFNSIQPAFTVLSSDTIGLQVSFTTTRTTNTTFTYTLGNGNATFFTTPLPIRHNLLRALDWTNSGHTGTANKIAAFNGSGIAVYQDTAWHKGSLGTFYLHQKDSTLAASKISYADTINKIATKKDIEDTVALTDYTYTKSQLNTSGGGGLVHFNNVTNKYVVYKAIASGSAYSLTTTDTVLLFGTNRPIDTIKTVGTYRLTARINLKYNGATFAANQTATFKIRRVNNIATDISGSSTTITLGVVTTLTEGIGTIILPLGLYYSTNVITDILQLRGVISSAPSAGSVDVTEAEIVAEKVN